MAKWSNLVGQPISFFTQYANNITGSINILQNMIKFGYFSFAPIPNLSGNISIGFANCSKLYYMFYATTRGDYISSSNANSKISGNISVFGDKYNFRSLTFASCPNIIGEAKSLKNLKKLYYVDFRGDSCTGSKTDLYNNGANVTAFAI